MQLSEARRRHHHRPTHDMTWSEISQVGKRQTVRRKNRLNISRVRQKGVLQADKGLVGQCFLAEAHSSSLETNQGTPLALIGDHFPCARLLSQSDRIAQRRDHEQSLPLRIQNKEKTGYQQAKTK